jgi:hypothetical protein
MINFVGSFLLGVSGTLFLGSWMVCRTTARLLEEIKEAQHPKRRPHGIADMPEGNNE